MQDKYNKGPKLKVNNQRSLMKQQIVTDCYGLSDQLGVLPVYLTLKCEATKNSIFGWCTQR